MSRKWSPAAEVARDKLFDQLQFSGLPAAERWQMIDAFAHALAEQQRAEGDSWGQQPAAGKVYRAAADLIDPLSADPARQDGGAHREAPIDLAEAQRLAEGHASALTELYGRLRQAGHAYASNSAHTASEAADELAKQLRDDQAKLPARPDEETLSRGRYDVPPGTEEWFPPGFLDRINKGRPGEEPTA